MKKALLIIILACFCVSCKSVDIPLGVQVGARPLMEKYFLWCGEYPSNIDSLLTFCGTFSPEDYEPTDSLAMAANFILKEKDNLKLEYLNPTVMTEKLVITLNEDTLVYMQGKKHLSFLWDMLFLYGYYYYSFPSSLDDLKLLFAAVKGTENDPLFDRCCPSTLRYLENNLYRISWESNDTMMLIKSGNDTIDFQYGDYNPPCMQYEWPDRYKFRYFDTRGVCIPPQKIDSVFRQEMKAIRINGHYVDLVNNHFLDPALVYTKSDGLQLYCENLPASLDSEWFRELADYCREFAERHGISKIIFASPCYQRSN